MKPMFNGLLCLALAVVCTGCGTSQGRLWWGCRQPTCYTPSTSSYRQTARPQYSPTVDPYLHNPPAEAEPEVETAPAVTSEVLDAAPIPQPIPAPQPTPAASRQPLKMPAPPAEKSESVQYYFPKGNTPTQSAAVPEEEGPVLEQSSLGRPRGFSPDQILEDGKFALTLKRPSTKVRLLAPVAIEPGQVVPVSMQGAKAPLLHPVPLKD